MFVRDERKTGHLGESHANELRYRYVSVRESLSRMDNGPTQLSTKAHSVWGLVTMRLQFADDGPVCFPRNRSRTAAHPAASSAPVGTFDNSSAGTPARPRSQPPARRRSRSGSPSLYSEGQTHNRSCRAHGCSRSALPTAGPSGARRAAGTRSPSLSLRRRRPPGDRRVLTQVGDCAESTTLPHSCR
jgi:hypothetical protein